MDVKTVHFKLNRFLSLFRLSLDLVILQIKSKFLPIETRTNKKHKTIGNREFYQWFHSYFVFVQVLNRLSDLYLY